MASNAISAQGTLFKVESDSSVGLFATIPETSKIGAPNIKFDLLDATSHDSTGGFKEYVPGLADGESATGEFFLVPGNAIHIQLRTDSYAKTKKNFSIIFPGAGTGATITFAGYITQISPKADINTLVMNSLTVKVTGQPTWA